MPAASTIGTTSAAPVSPSGVSSIEGGNPLFRIVAPERLVVDVLLGDQLRRKLIFENTGSYFKNRAVVVGRAGLERLPGDRVLQIHDAVFRVEVRRLRDGCVGLSLADRVEFLRNSVIADNDDVALFASRMKQAFTLQGLQCRREENAAGVHVDRLEIGRRVENGVETRR